MKTRFFKAIVLSVIAGAMVSCSQELTESVLTQQLSSDKEITKLSANIGNFRSEPLEGTSDQAPQTRSTIIEDGDGNLQLVWSDKDTLGIFPTSGYQVPFTIASQAGTKNATFNVAVGDY